MSRKSGYFVVYRDIFGHPVFANILQASLWIYMISSASHQDKHLDLWIPQYLYVEVK